MMSTFKCVVDASVGIKQFVPDPLSNKVNQLFSLLTNASCQFYVPDLFYIECTNILWKYVRAGQYAAVDIQKDLASLKAFPLNVVSTADLIEDAANIAVKHNISAYDASYIALSNQVDAILLTLDLRLVKNLAATSYNIFSFIDFEIPTLP